MCLFLYIVMYGFELFCVCVVVYEIIIGVIVVYVFDLMLWMCVDDDGVVVFNGCGKFY